MTRARAWIAAALVALALAGGGAWSLRWLANDSADPSVVSIAAAPVYQDAALLERAWTLPAATAYRPVFASQPNQSTCGPTSIANALRSLGRDATVDGVIDRAGLWTVFGQLPGGITLDQAADALRAQGAGEVTVLRGLDLPAFRAAVAQANDPRVRVIANFTRIPLFGKGHGHFSPILGYLPESDLVFVGDTNAAFGPWLAPLPRLHEAADTVDVSSGEKRGLLVLTAE